MPFRFYIDSQLVDQPINDKQLTTTIKRDSQTGGINITQDAELQWAANNAPATGETSAYTYLKGLFDSSVCSEANIVIYDEVSDSATYKVYTGVIKITQVEIDEQRLILKTKVQDNSFYAYIYNNRELKVNLAGTFTKNNELITALEPYVLNLFNSNGCAYGSDVGVAFHGFLLQDVFTYVIASITDNQVTFQSDYLDGLDQQLFIMKGQDILNPFNLVSEVPTYELSFNELLIETDKIKNIAYWIDESDPDNPIFRLEDYESTFDGLNVQTFDDIKHIRTYVDTSRLYASVSCGNGAVVSGNAGWLTWNEARSVYGWKDEQFHPLGQCNTSADLNLDSQFILSNNAIQDTGIGQSTALIDNYFFIECSPVDTVLKEANAYQWDFFGQGDCFYNLGLNNFSKLQRHSTKFETKFGNFLGIGSAGFRALLGDNNGSDYPFTAGFVGSGANYIPYGGITITPPFVNDTTNGGYDGGNNYDQVLYQYTLAADGDYSFNVRFYVDADGFSGDYLQMQVEYRLYDAGATLKTTYTYTATVGVNGSTIRDFPWVMNGVATDYVETRLRLEWFPYSGQTPDQIVRNIVFVYNSYWECNGSPDGGITVTVGNDNVKKLRHEFIYDLTQTEFRNIKAFPIGMMTFNKDEADRYGWIEEMKHDHQTGRTQIKLITNNAITS